MRVILPWEQLDTRIPPVALYAFEQCLVLLIRVITFQIAVTSRVLRLALGPEYVSGAAARYCDKYNVALLRRTPSGAYARDEVWSTPEWIVRCFAAAPHALRAAGWMVALWLAYWGVLYVGESLVDSISTSSGAGGYRGGYEVSTPFRPLAAYDMREFIRQYYRLSGAPDKVGEALAGAFDVLAIAAGGARGGAGLLSAGASGRLLAGATAPIDDDALADGVDRTADRNSNNIPDYLEELELKRIQDEVYSKIESSMMRAVGSGGGGAGDGTAGNALSTGIDDVFISQEARLLHAQRALADSSWDVSPAYEALRVCQDVHRYSIHEQLISGTAPVCWDALVHGLDFEYNLPRYLSDFESVAASRPLDTRSTRAVRRDVDGQLKRQSVRKVREAGVESVTTCVCNAHLGIVEPFAYVATEGKPSRLYIDPVLETRRAPTDAEMAASGRAHELAEAFSERETRYGVRPDGIWTQLHAADEAFYAEISSTRYVRYRRNALVSYKTLPGVAELSKFYGPELAHVHSAYALGCAAAQHETRQRANMTQETFLLQLARDFFHKSDAMVHRNACYRRLTSERQRVSDIKTVQYLQQKREKDHIRQGLSGAGKSIEVAKEYGWKYVKTLIDIGVDTMYGFVGAQKEQDRLDAEADVTSHPKLAVRKSELLSEIDMGCVTKCVAQNTLMLQNRQAYHDYYVRKIPDARDVLRPDVKREGVVFMEGTSRYGSTPVSPDRRS